MNKDNKLNSQKEIVKAAADICEIIKDVDQKYIGNLFYFISSKMFRVYSNPICSQWRFLYNKLNEMSEQIGIVKHYDGDNNG